MIERLTANPEQLRELRDVFQTGAALTRSRFLLQHLNLLNNFPIGGKQAAETISEFFQKAEEGYIISQRSGKMNIQVLANIDDAASDPQSLSKRASEDIVHFGQAATALSYLSSQKRVTFADFLYPADKLDLGDMELQETYWSCNLDWDRLWELMIKLDRQSKDVFYKHELLPVEDILRVGHFFLAGMNLSFLDH